MTSKPFGHFGCRVTVHCQGPAHVSHTQLFDLNDLDFDDPGVVPRIQAKARELFLLSCGSCLCRCDGKSTVRVPILRTEREHRAAVEAFAAAWNLMTLEPIGTGKE